MSEWIDRVRTNSVWQSLETFGAAIDRASAREAIDAEAVEGLERLRAVLTFCGKRLASVDPFLMEMTSLTRIGTAWTTAQVELEAFVADGAIAHVQAANTQADTVLQSLSSVLPPLGHDDLTTISAAAATYRATLKGYLDEASKANTALKKISAENLAKQAELGSKVDSETQRISAALAEYQSQFAIGQTTRTSEFSTAQSERQVAIAETLVQFDKAFNDAQSERQTKHSTTLADQQAQFTTAQEERAKADTEARAERQAAYSALMIDYTQKLGEQNTQFAAQTAAAERASNEALADLKKVYENSAQAILDEINVHRTQVEKLVGVIGNLGVTSGYQLVANHARVALYIWQGLTVAALGGLVSVAYVIAFTPHVGHGDFVQGFATRIFLTIAIGVFAAYAASQADKASVVERKNRKLALELEAVGPYIAPLPEEMQNKFRADLGERSFGVPDGEPKKSDSSASPATAIDVMKSKEVRELLEEIVQRVIKTKG